MNNLSLTRIKDVVEHHRIVFGVIGALLIAVLMTVISMALYISSGASRLDLSRPGYERARDGLSNQPTEKPFSATGPINTSVADDFQERFTRHREMLKKLDDYSTNALDDSELQIAPEEPASE